MNKQKLYSYIAFLVFLEKLHSKNQFHGRLKASNIILNDNFYPLVTDLFLYKLDDDSNFDKTIDLIVSLAPEVLFNSKRSLKSDIYSFGIISLQIFLQKINIFSDNDEISNLEKEILNFDFSEVLESIPEPIRPIIQKCLLFDSDNRPEASEIKKVIGATLMTDKYKENFKSLQNFIQSKNDITEAKLKKEADKGEINSIFKYAVKIRNKKPIEALLYFRYISILDPNHSSKQYYESMCKKMRPKNDIDNYNNIIQQPIEEKSSKFVHLKDDQFFMEKEVNMNEIVNDVKSNYKKEELIDFDYEKLRAKGFILTKGAQKRLTKIYRYLLEGVPVLLEGPTGTSKTRSAEIVCEMLEKRLVKYNLSSETKTGDLLGRYVGDRNSFSGIKMHEGPFIDAFEGRTDDENNEMSCVLLLDEINLANQECLHFIEETLDSDEISTEIPGMPLKKIHKGPGFRLIATQNPNKGLFAHKRQDLGLKFLSRFQVINFPKLDDIELKEIAKGLAKCDDFKYKNDDKLIEDLVDFHVKWSELPEIKDEVQCFTVREIEATIHALCGKEPLNPYDAVMTIYGARYQKEKKSLLMKTLLSFKSFIKYKEQSVKNNKNFNYIFNGIEFPFCYHNKNLENALKSVFFSFKMKRHVILAGEEGCGLTQIARLIAECHNKNLKSTDKNSQKEFFCICTEETKCSDLIGGQKASENIEKSKSLIKWKRGFLSKAIKSGHCAILDSIDEATSTVTERLNPLLDQKYGKEEMIFYVPENPNEPEIRIHPNFELLCTCKIDKINQMSPAFINRFDVIVLENQLEDIKENELKDLIKILMKETVNEKSSSIEEIKPVDDKEEAKKKYLKSCFASDDYEDYYSDDEIDNDTNDANGNDKDNDNKSNQDIDISDDIINLINRKLDKGKLPSFQNLSQFCKAVSKYLLFFKNEKTVTSEQIVDFAYKMLQKTTDFKDDEIPPKMIDYLLANLKNKEKEINGQFIYKDSKILKIFIAKLFAASIINLPVCVYGPTGAGKTSAAEQFSRERSIKGYQKHSFHAGTKPNHFYATTTIQDKKISLKYGSLTTAMINGQVFIADEMNLSSITNMKSLAPALEPCIGKKVFIPGIGESISIDPDFFFIACQNELGTLGRNAIPSSIASRFRYFDYPELKEEEISELCLQKRMVLYKIKDQDDLNQNDEFVKDSRNLGRFMIALNNLKQRVIPKWSFRDITKIFLRKRKQDIPENSNKYKNITFYHQVLFYAISIANEEDSKEMLDILCDLIQSKFEIKLEQRNSLKDDYLATPKFDGKFINKGKCAILCNEADIHFPGPLLNAFFTVKLSDDSEPIIFMGSSGYKTFLSKKILNNAKTITLNQESTNAQLLGKSYPFTRTESKLFYLDTLSKMLNINNDIAYNLKNKLQDATLTIYDFIPIIATIPNDIQSKMFDQLHKKPNSLTKLLDEVFSKYLNRNLPQSFKYSFINLATKLFEVSDTNNDSIISNFVFEFKPGLFLTSILEGKCLILKNLSNIQTIVFERFNELFSGEHSLTLQEDINNTFTDEKSDRKLNKFNDDFRVIGTCPPNSINKLSEAVLSRFTVIYTHAYSSEDQKNVLYNLEGLNIDIKLINYVISFSEHMKEEKLIKRSIPFCQMINIIEMCSKLFASNDMVNQIDILKTALYRVVLGLIEKRDRNKGKLREKINNIFTEINLQLPEELSSPLKESPLYITNENKSDVVKSKISNLSIPSSTAKEVDSNLMFTRMFVEMVDTIHLGIASQTPVILEGMPGQGKQTAIKYVADTLGYNIINIMISQSTKADDLLGKLTISYDEKHNIRVEIIKTKLIEAIESESKASQSLIVFHNINHASSAVLEVIQTIFDPHEANICLTNGSLVHKGKLNLIGIYNPQNGHSNRENLPTSLIYSSIYYIVNNPNKEELKMVIQTLFSKTEFNDDCINFISCFNETNKFAKDNNTSSALTLNDVVKYIIFREKTFSKFDRDIITQMIFAYRFINEDIIQKVKKAIKVKDMNFSPTFTYNSDNTILNINVKNDESTEFQEGINLHTFSNQIDNEQIEYNINCLTLPQKHCLLFLANSVLSKRSCILQGSTASGKSHIIRLFAQMLGQDLIVYQMNKDTGISILVGQPLLSSSLNEDEIDEIKLLFANLKVVKQFNDFISEKFSENPNEWKLDDFTSFISFAESNIKAIDEDNFDFINDSILGIKKIMRQENRFNQQESAFIKAIKEGKWVLIDGIESAPPEIAQKISSLCGDDPELHLIESGKNNYFSRNNTEYSQPISDNFHLFVTYNPSSQKENVSLDPAFFNKCVSFTLPPIDSVPEYSAQVLHGSLLKLSYPNDVAVQIGTRLSMSHKIAKDESINNNDLFAGDLQFTGRTLKFITTEFRLHSEESKRKENNDITNKIYNPICNSFHSFYWNSEMRNEKDDEKGKKSDQNLMEKMINEFSNSADDNIITRLVHKSDNPKIRNKDVLKVLRSVQLYAIDHKIEKSDFSYQFIQKCRKIQLSDVPYVITHIEDTLSIIEQNTFSSHKSNKFEYPQITIILNLLNEISKSIPNVNNELRDVQLDNQDLLTIKELENPLLKLQLLEKLQSEDFQYFNKDIPEVFLNRNLFNLFQIVLDMSQNRTINDFKEFVSIISNDQTLIPEIERIFPFKLFEGKCFETINYWITMFSKLYKQRITFHVIIKDNNFDFNNEKSWFEPTYVFDQKDDVSDLLLHPGTILKIESPQPVVKEGVKKRRRKIHNYMIKENTSNDELLEKSYQTFDLTNYILNHKLEDIKINDEICKHMDEDSYPKPTLNEYQMPKYNSLLPKNTKKKSMISNIMSFIYYVPPEKHESMFICLHKLEVDILQSLTQMLDSLNKKNINTIFALIKWMDCSNNFSLGDENSYLWRVLNGKFVTNKQMKESKIKEEITNIENEIEYLSSTPSIYGWSTNNYVKIISDGVLLEYQKLLQDKIAQDKEKLLKSNLYQILNKVKETRPKKAGHKNFKDNFIQSIRKIIENNPTQDMYNKCAYYYDEFIKLLKSDSSYSKENLDWPFSNIPPLPESNYTDSIKLFEHVLWYSHCFSIIKTINDQKDINVIKNISDLSEIQEMQEISKYLINKICGNNSKDKKIEIHDIDILYSTLNAQFICRLINDNLFDKIQELDTIFNNLEERKSDIYEMRWINQIANQYPLNFQIVLPKILPNDIFSLFVCYEDEKSHVIGPYLKTVFNVKNTDIAKSILDFLRKKSTSDPSKFSKYSVLVSIEIYKNLIENKKDLPKDPMQFKAFIINELDKIIDIDGIISFIKEEFKFLDDPNEFKLSIKKELNIPINSDDFDSFVHKEFDVLKDTNEYKIFVKSKLDMPENSKERFNSQVRRIYILKNILNILLIGDKLAKCKPYRFIFNDTVFLEKEWIKNKDFVNKYPSLLYWLSLNDDCREALQNKFGSYEFSESNLPFWLFVVRIMSSLQCIKFYSQDDSELAILIRDTITKKSLKYFLKAKSLELGTSWVNFLLPSVPSEIFDSSYKLLYQFFINLSQDRSKNTKIIKDQKETTVERIASIVTEKVFQGKVDELLEMSFKLKDETLSFIIDPQQSINEKVNKSMKLLLTNFINLPEFQGLKNSSIALKDELSSLVDQLKNLCNEETESIKNEYDHIREEKAQSIRVEILNLIDQYNTLFEELTNSEKTERMDRNEFTAKVKQLIDIRSNRYINKLNQDKGEKELKIIVVGYYCYSEKTLQIVFPEHLHKKPYIFENKPLKSHDMQCVYLNNNEFKDSDIMISKLETFGDWNFIHKFLSLDSFYPISFENPKIDEISKEQSNNIQNPYLIFGKYMKLDDLIYVLKDKINKLLPLIDEIEKNFTEYKIKYNTLDNLNEINKIINYLFPLLDAKYSNDQPKELVEINTFLNKLKIKIKQIGAYTTKLQKKAESDRIKQKYDEVKDMTKISIFSSKYNIPFPFKEKIDLKKSIFSSLNNCDFLSSPFLSLEDDSITCCLETINCEIGPIIPSLYSGNISLNFISFIDHPITIEVHPKDPSFKSWFYSTTYKPKEFAKIYITLVNPSSDKHEEYDINADIIISSPGLKSLTLPSNFHILIAPQVVYFSCDNYNISYDTDSNNIYLCQNRLLSNSILSFSIENFIIKEQLAYKVQLENLKDNKAPKPEKSITKDNKLKVSIPSVDKPTRLNCSFNFKFSEKFSTKLIMDSVIVPFDFSFYLYDYNQRKYVDDSSKIYYSGSLKDREIILHFKIASPLFEIFKKDKSVSFNGKIRLGFPKEIIVVKNTIGEAFKIDSEKEFDIICKVKSRVYSRYNYISLTINNEEKKINVYFTEPEPLFDTKGFLNLYKHPNLYGIFNNQKYEPIKKDTDLNKFIAICSPFDSTLFMQPQLKYSEDCTIKYSEKNKFVNLSCEGGKTEYVKDRSEYRGQYLNRSIPFIGITQNQWYPCHSEYSSKIKKWSILEVTKENKKKAEDAIYDLPYYYRISKSNFTRFVKMINSYKVLLGLKEIILDPQFKCFKDNLECSDQILSYIEQYRTCDVNVEVVICYNIICLLHNSFAKKYEEYKNNDFYLKPPISYKDLDDMSNMLYHEYCRIEVNYYYFAKASDKLMNKISEIECGELPPIEMQKEAYLLGITPKDVKRSVEPDYIERSMKGKKVISSKSIKVNLPEINLPDLSNPDDLSITEMDNFYQTCLKGTRILPIFVKNISSCKTEENITAAYNYFVLLFRAFKGLEQIDRSIISQSVNDFRDSFCSMIGKFMKAGMKISEYIPLKYIPDNEANQDFISLPNKNPLYLPPDSWNDEIFASNDSYMFTRMSSSYEKIHVGEMKVKAFDDDQQLDSLSNILSSKETKSATLQTNQNKSRLGKVKVSKIVDEMSSIKDDSKEEKKVDGEEEEEINDDDGEEEEKDEVIEYHVTLDKESVEINNENLDGLVSNFSESDSVKASIARMKKINELTDIVIKDCNIPSINALFLKQPTININELPIQSLIKNSLSLSQQLIIAASNQDIPFSSLCANILVDCSCFISVENKLFNMLLICALTNALDVLTIPYAVSVFGDSNFKYVIKPFEEKHSPFALQKIVDCLFIKRFCSHLPTAIKFGIDNMAHKTRNQRVIFTFTNGLDEQIRLTKSWAETIFNSELISFLFVFIKSTELDSKDAEYLQTVWNDFEILSKKNGAKSLLKVTPINAQLTSFNSFVDSFVFVMKRSSEEENKQPFKTPLFSVKEPLQNPDSFNQLIGSKNKNMFSENNSVYFDTTDVFKNMTSKIDRLDASIYRNRLNNVIQPLSEKKSENLIQLTKNFIENKTKINQSTLETIFRPNKASQTVLSNTGSDIDITALILNIINPVPDPLIYLEEKGGLIRNYGVSVIIDPSFSCLFNLSEAHTLLTIRHILSSFAALDIPCFDLIVSGCPQPTVLCSEVGTLHALDQKSSIWESLFSLLERPVQKSDLASAINTAYDIKRMRSKDYSSFLFVITDGLYEKSERNRILQVVNNCVQSGTAVFGIGIGSYPKGIEYLFPQIVFSPNPSLAMKCVASLFGDSISGRMEKMPPIYPMDLRFDDIKESFKNLINNEDNPIYNNLKEELSKIKHLQDAFRHYYNSEGDIGNATKGFTNFEGEDAEMYSKDTFKSQKILIVMLWDYTLNPGKENPALQTKYVYENFDSKRKECIKTAVEHFGITVEVVRNYKDAIESLIRQTKEGFCDYYAVWVMCGPPIGILPDKSKYTNLVGQFIDVLTQFWKNGGALVFWAEGYPLYYQLNLFLDKNGFGFNVEGNHKGYKDLKPDDSNELSNQQTFNRHPQGDETNERSSIAHNLGIIFEGVTISYAKYDLEKIKPFIPFSRDSEGGISSMFLPGDRKKGTGDIVIDCGYTKCFANLTENGTYRYIQNIAGWTMNMETHISSGFNPKEWRPKAVTHSINLSEEWKYPLVQGTNEVDIIFCSDATGSMGSWLDAAKTRSKSIADASCSKYPDKSFRFGAIFYRDPIDSAGDSNDYFQPTSNISSLVSFMNPQQPDGGGDGPEDWVGAYRILLNTINWRPGASRALIHIADAPAHGSDWGGSGSHEDQNSLLHPLIHQCAKQNIFISAINVNSSAAPSFNKILEIYRSEGKEKLFKMSSISSCGSDEAGNFLQNVTADLLSNISAFDSSLPFST